MIAPTHNPLDAQARLGLASPTTPSPAPAAPNGNPVPPGSTPANVADNIKANLSEGEVVWPADVVKFYGMDWINKQFLKAKQGMAGMAHSGMIAPPPGGVNPQHLPPAPEPGQPAKFAEGGMVSGQECYSKGGLVTAPHNRGMVQMPTQDLSNNYAAGGLVAPMPTASVSAALPSAHISTALPAGHISPVGFAIPHNIGVVHTGIKGPVHNYHIPPVKLATGGLVQSPTAVPMTAPSPMQSAMNNPSSVAPINPAQQPHTTASPLGLGAYPYTA